VLVLELCRDQCLNYDVHSSLDKITCPIFLGLGRYDYFNPPYICDQCRKYCSNMTIDVFEKGGHRRQLEEAENFEKKC